MTRKISFRTKAILTVDIIVVAVSAILVVFFVSHESDMIRQQLADRGTAFAENLASNSEYGIFAGNREALEKLVSDIGEYPDVVYGSVMDSKGVVLAESGKITPPAGLRREKTISLGDVELTPFSSHGKNYYDLMAEVETRQRTKSDEGNFLFGETEPGEKQMIGSVRVGLSLEASGLIIRKAQSTLIAVVSLIVVILSIFISLITGLALRPIKKLLEATGRIAGGDLDCRVDVKSGDEFGRLADAFNLMGAGIKKTMVSMEVLESEQKRFADIAESSGDWIWEIDPRGKYTYSSPVSEKVIGYKPEEVVEKYFYDFVAEDSREWVKEKVLYCIALEDIFRGIESRHIMKNGRVVTLEVTGMPIFGKKGGLTGYRGVARDISARKNAEEAMLESVKIKNAFISTVSHELRTPLTAIREGVSIVLDGETGDLNGEQKEFLDSARRNVDRLARLINDVLDFSKIRAGKMVLHMKENDIAEPLRDVWNAQKLLAEKKGLYLETEISHGIPRLMFDADRIVQVLTNLVNNALKFTEKGGVTVRAMVKSGAVSVSVEDTGQGIREDDLSKVFQEFHQVEDDKTRKTGGTGLGLAICKEIMELHGGTIRVASEYGKGAKFEIVLPLSRRYKILVVDDEDSFLDFAEKFLSSKGYDVVKTKTGRGGIEAVRSGKIDLVILDMRLPDMNGWEIIGRLRSFNDSAEIPIIAVSGHKDELEKLGSLPQGEGRLAIPRISKPCSPQEILSEIEKFLK